MQRMRIDDGANLWLGLQNIEMNAPRECPTILNKSVAKLRFIHAINPR
jgi:hypothetical protein